MTAALATGESTPRAAGEATLASLTRAMENPLAAIVASSQLLVEELGPRHRCTGLACLIRETGRRLHRTIHDLSVLASPASFHPRPTDLTALLRAETMGAGERARARAVQVLANLPADPVMIEADPALLASAVERILDHQLAVVPAQGLVEVSLHHNHPERVRVIFSDNGPPVPRDGLRMIFQPFYACAGRDCGLDLAAVERIVRLHGGSIRALRNARGGLTFAWHLPLSCKSASRRSRP